MIQNKKVKMILLGMFFSLGTMANPIVLVNGQSVEKTPSKISFDGDNVVVSFSDGTTQSQDMSTTVVKFTEETGVFFTKASYFQSNSIVKNSLSISGINETSDIAIYDTNGKICHKQKAGAESITIDVTGLKPAVYLLMVDNQIIKFIKE
ncbi:MAG: T9SS type A sorting domain-containing protein [Paludibacteraceae bacterium]